MQVAWQKGPEVQQVWRDVLALLAYPHVWVRKAAGRLLGLLLSSSKLGEPCVIPPVHLIGLLPCHVLCKSHALLPAAKVYVYVRWSHIVHKANPYNLDIKQRQF